MNYTGPVFRPPFEANSLLLQVTVGCSHNACTFCTMYKDTCFAVAPMEQIEKDLREARAQLSTVRRIFLVNADPFVLSAVKLKAIAEKINEIFPEIQTISAYASVKNIIDKTDEELKELRRLKINQLNIGVESGLDKVLQHLNKGFTLDEARTQLQRLNKAGMDFSANIILGAAGEKDSLENARASSKLMNEVKPYLIFLATLHVDPGSKLYEELQAGQFVENTLGGNLEEEAEFLRNLNLTNCIFFGIHTSNVIPLLGKLPYDKEALLKELEQGKISLPEKVLNARPQKGYEGASILE